MRWLLRALFVVLAAAVLSGCASTYVVHMNNGEKMYVEPPIILTNDDKYYVFNVNGQKKVVYFDDVYYIDKAAEICYQNEKTYSFVCFESFYGD